VKIGVDLGTTTSTVVRLDPRGKPIHPGVPVPSLGAWRNGELVFGEDAYIALGNPEVPAFPVRDIKLSLGTKEIRVGPHVLETEEVVAQLLRYLADKDARGAVIEEAVIGTPVSVSEGHRQALLRSAERAGFRKTRLVYEPTSALVGAIEPRAMSEKSTVLVVDWGGGTLDISLIRKEYDCLREIAVDGDVSTLGGSQMDSRILQRLLERSPGIKSRLAEVPEGIDRIKVEIEKEKRSILESHSPETDDAELTTRFLAQRLVLRGQDVVDVATEMAAEAAEQILQFLFRASLGVTEITHVLFAGGVSRCAIVRDRILEVLPEVTVIETTIPQLLTGYGCARLLRYGFELQLAADFGVRQSDESFCLMLPAGHGIGLGTYRTADFMVTDPLAQEAVFDFGLLPSGGVAQGMISGPAKGFVSLKTLFVRCQNRPGGLTGSSYDLVRAYCGISHALAAIIFAESNVAGASVSDTASGIPFVTRLMGTG